MKALTRILIILSIALALVMFSDPADAEDIYERASRVTNRHLYKTSKGCGCDVWKHSDSEIWINKNDYLVYSFLYTVSNPKASRRIQLIYRWDKNEKQYSISIFPESEY